MNVASFIRVGEFISVLWRRPHITVFGRDYIHIIDLVEAHWLTLQYLQAGKESVAFNLDNGYSVENVIQAVRWPMQPKYSKH